MFKVAVTALYLIFIAHFTFQAIKIGKLSKGLTSAKMLSAEQKKEIKMRRGRIFLSMMMVVIIVFFMFLFKYG